MMIMKLKFGIVPQQDQRRSTASEIMFDSLFSHQSNPDKSIGAEASNNEQSKGKS